MPATASASGNFSESDDDASFSSCLELDCGDTPDEQVSRIEQMICEADDDFTPFGSCAPEVDLVFEDAEHPFQEQFEDEEIVADRYSSRKATSPRTIGVFDRTIGPPAVKEAMPVRVVAEQSQTIQEVQSVAQVVELSADKPHTLVLPVCRQDESRSEDADVLIIESGYDDGTGEPPTYKIAPVRRQEYGQLFAKLRRKTV